MMTRLAADHRAPRTARAFVEGALAAGTPPAGVPVDDVVLIASELVTNAVRAGAGWVDLALRVTRRRVDLVVTDDARGLPVLATADHEAVGGRGLRIVDQLADTWMVTPREKGKVVTATWLDRTAPPGR
jgi:anti-sigma regulatory factor (Ser/Thr protein kinase)